MNLFYYFSGSLINELNISHVFILYIFFILHENYVLNFLTVILSAQDWLYIYIIYIYNFFGSCLILLIILEIDIIFPILLQLKKWRLAEAVVLEQVVPDGEK